MDRSQEKLLGTDSDGLDETFFNLSGSANKQLLTTFFYFFHKHTNFFSTLVQTFNSLVLFLLYSMDFWCSYGYFKNNIPFYTFIFMFRFKVASCNISLIQLIQHGIDCYERGYLRNCYLHR